MLDTQKNTDIPQQNSQITNNR